MSEFLFPEKSISSFSKTSILVVLLLCLSPSLWAAQEAMVIVNRAVIFSDKKMSSPIGFVSKGKRVKVGEIPRNFAQVYPIVVSGKIAYIKVLDVSTELESTESNRLVAERFLKTTKKKYHTKYSVNYFSFHSQVSIEHENDDILDRDALTWNGVTLKGELVVSPRWDAGVIVNFMTAAKGSETIRVVEFGGFGGLKLIESNRFLFRWDAQLLAIPFAAYEVADNRVNGYGYSTGTGLNAALRFGQNWGLEGFAGVFYTKTMGFKLPAPLQSVSPSFVGSRLGVGLNYTF